MIVKLFSTSVFPAVTHSTARIIWTCSALRSVLNLHAAPFAAHLFSADPLQLSFDGDLGLQLVGVLVDPPEDKTELLPCSRLSWSYGLVGR